MDPQTYTVRQLLHFSLMGGKSTVGSELPRLKQVRYVRGPAPASMSYQLFCKRDAGKNFFAIKLLSLLLFTEASHSPE